jgi:hypothetical protein
LCDKTRCRFHQLCWDPFFFFLFFLSTGQIRRTGWMNDLGEEAEEYVECCVGRIGRGLYSTGQVGAWTDEQRGRVPVCYSWRWLFEERGLWVDAMMDEVEIAEDRVGSLMLVAGRVFWFSGQISFCELVFIMMCVFVSTVLSLNFLGPASWKYKYRP